MTSYYVAIFFVLLSDGTGYIPPLEAMTPACGIDGAVTGIQAVGGKTVSGVQQNPTTALWPDPQVVGKHCSQDISMRVGTLPAGTYELATTETGAGAHIGIDPHTSATWVRRVSNVPTPTSRITGTGFQLPATRTLEWDPAAPEDRIYAYRVTVDGAVLPLVTGPPVVLTLPVYKTYDISVQAINVDNESSDPVTVRYALDSPTQLPTSPDGTNGPIVVDAQHAVWTLGSNHETLRDGAHAGAGLGTTYLWFSGSVYVFGLNSAWYKFDSGNWLLVGANPMNLPSTCNNPTAHTLSIRVEDWTHIVAVGGRGKVSLTLANDYPIIQLQVKLGGQVIGEVTGADLRDMAGLYFSVPRIPAAYNITVAALDSVACTAQTTASREVKVQ